MLDYPRINFDLCAVCKRFLERMAPLQRKARHNKSLKPMFAAAGAWSNAADPYTLGLATWTAMEINGVKGGV